MVKIYNALSFTSLVLAFFCCTVAQAQKTGKTEAQLLQDALRTPSGHIRCLSTEHDHLLRQQYPDRGTNEEFEEWIGPLVEFYQREQANGNHSRVVITIPVVVHVIHNGDALGSGENIPDAQVISQIQVMNEDFRRMMGTPGYNTNPVGADTEIQFCLATLDPSNNPTNGINRVNMGTATWNSMAAIDGTLKPATIWDPTRYLNMWSVSFGGGMAGTLGYAQFPDNPQGLAGLGATGGAANSDGVVAGYNAFGSSTIFPGGTYAPPYDKGRTMTHEVGHWLGLRHIWGDGAACGASDFCNDTPMSDAANFGCPNTNSCVDPAPNPVDMVQNYMDYSDDLCMNIFTADQKARIISVMTFSPRRASLATSDRCGVPVPTISFALGTGGTVNEGTDCSYQDFVINLNISMAPSAAATVTFNTTGLTTATLGQDYDFFPASVIFPTGSTATRQVTLRIYNDGIVEANEIVELSFSVVTAGNAVAATGDLRTHDKTIISNDLTPGSSGSVVILSENFEGGTIGAFTTAGNAGSDRFLNGNVAAANSGFWNIAATNTGRFAYSNDDRCNCNKAADRLTSPTFSLAGAYTAATLTFDHAFSAMPGETGQVQIRVGAGAWTTIATLTNTSTGAPGVVTTPWVNGFSVNLAPYIGQAILQIRFNYFDGGGWLYGMALDNIVIAASAPANIQTVDNTVSPRNIPVTSLATVHYYDPATGNVMGTIQNLSTWNYQCTRVEVDRDAVAAGAATAPFWDNITGNRLAAKTFFVAPTNNTPTGSYTITLYYTEAEIAAWEAATGKSRATLKIIKVSNNPIETITPANFSAYTIEQQAATIGAFGTNITLTATFNTGFSGFGIGDPGTPPAVLLPLELISFTGKKENKNIALNWQTQNEFNVNRYVLEKSADGVVFEIINEQQAKGNGLGAIENNYNYLDTKPFNGFNYYRLGQIDMDGQQTYSKIIAISVEEEPAPVLALSPNPVSYDMTVEYNSPQKAEISIEIYDMVGHQLLSSNHLPVEAGSNNILLNVEEYPAGMYLIRVKQGSHAAAKTFVKK